MDGIRTFLRKHLAPEGEHLPGSHYHYSEIMPSSAFPPGTVPPSGSHLFVAHRMAVHVPGAVHHVENDAPVSLESHSHYQHLPVGEPETVHLPDVRRQADDDAVIMHHFAPHDDHPGRSFMSFEMGTADRGEDYESPGIYSKDTQHHVKALLSVHPEHAQNLVHVGGVELPHPLEHYGKSADEKAASGAPFIHGFVAHNAFESDLGKPGGERHVLETEPNTVSFSADIGRRTSMVLAHPHTILDIRHHSHTDPDGMTGGTPDALDAHRHFEVHGRGIIEPSFMAADVTDQMKRFAGMHPADVVAEFEKPRHYGATDSMEGIRKAIAHRTDAVPTEGIRTYLGAPSTSSRRTRLSVGH